MSATYIIGAATPVNIPHGIFTLESIYAIKVAPTSLAHVGVYKIDVKVTDPFGLFAISTY
jgi:hypothetical protein